MRDLERVISRRPGATSVQGVFREDADDPAESATWTMPERARAALAAASGCGMGPVAR